MSKSQRDKQLSLFPKKDVPRLQPHQASPAQFGKLPGIQWHGNYDPSSVSKPDEMVDIIGEGSWDMDRDYVVGGVHAGTKRAAKDALDWHGPFDLLRAVHPTPNPQAEGYTLEDYGYDENAHQDEVNRRGGTHGYLHPVLPERESIQRGKKQDYGDNWTPALSRANPSLRREVLNSDEGEPIHVGEFSRGLRYENASEHPGSISTLMPNNNPMQHSDYVERALRTASGGVHPLTHHLFNKGLLDQVEAQRYLPPSRPQTGGAGEGHSEKKRDMRTARSSALRKKSATLNGQQMEMF